MHPRWTLAELLTITKSQPAQQELQRTSGKLLFGILFLQHRSSPEGTDQQLYKHC